MINTGGVKPAAGKKVNKLGVGLGMAGNAMGAIAKNRIQNRIQGGAKIPMQGGPQINPLPSNPGLDIGPSQLPFAPPMPGPEMPMPDQSLPPMMPPQGGLDLAPAQLPFMPPPMPNQGLPIPPGIGMSSARFPNRGMNFPQQTSFPRGRQYGRPAPRTY